MSNSCKEYIDDIYIDINAIIIDNNINNFVNIFYDEYMYKIDATIDASIDASIAKLTKISSKSYLSYLTIDLLRYLQRKILQRYLQR